MKDESIVQMVSAVRKKLEDGIGKCATKEAIDEYSRGFQDCYEVLTDEHRNVFRQQVAKWAESYLTSRE